MLKNKIESLDDDLAHYLSFTRQPFNFVKVCKFIYDNLYSNVDNYNYERRHLYARYYGLMKKIDSRTYKPTPVFEHILNLSNNNFENKELYQKVINQQLEKIYYYSPFGKGKSSFRLYPIFLLYKILLHVGKETGDYKITAKEFKYLVATTKKFDSWASTLKLIMENRDSNMLDNVNFKVDLRFHHIAKQLSTLSLGPRGGKPDYYKIAESKLDEVKTKVSTFEFVKTIKKGKDGYLPCGIMDEEEYKDFLQSNTAAVPV